MSSVTTATLVFHVSGIAQPTSSGQPARLSYRMEYGWPRSEFVVIVPDPLGIKITAPANHRVQLNFQVKSALPCEILGVSFSELAPVLSAGTPAPVPAPAPDAAKRRDPAGGLTVGQFDFPLVLLTRRQEMVAVLGGPPELTAVTVPPDTLSVIDLNLAAKAGMQYTFMIVTQQMTAAGQSAGLGLIDPNIINEPKHGGG